MNELFTIKPIAKIYTDFNERFGIPRQPGLVEGLQARIIFEEEFRDINSLKGIEEYDYLWIIWCFSRTLTDMNASPVKWSSTVAPPRLGGKVRKGVFASRSPYRPNSLGLSSVKFISLENDSSLGPVLTVEGADILNGTEIFDIKPYVPYSDCHPDAKQGYSVDGRDFLEVIFPEHELLKVAPQKRRALLGILRQDPRGSYEKQNGYIYGLSFADYDVRFTVDGTVLTVSEVCPVTGPPVKKIK